MHLRHTRLLLLLIPILLIIPGTVSMLQVASAQAGDDCVTFGTWSNTIFPAIPSPHHEGATVTHNGRVYALSGYSGSGVTSSRVDVYDIGSNTWLPDGVRPPDIPDPVGLSHIMAAVDPINGDIWLAGGYAGNDPGPATDRVWRYNIATNTWFAGPALPGPRAAAGVTIVGRNLHVFGGLVNRRDNAADHWILNLDNIAAGWQTRAPMPDARGHFGVAVVNDQIYAIGGQFFHDGPPSPVDLALVHRYDPATNTWTRLGDLPFERSHIESNTFVANGYIFVTGGRDNSCCGPLRFLDNFTIYNPTTDTWTELDPLPVQRYSHIATTFNGQVMISGGGGVGFALQGDTWGTTMDISCLSTLPTDTPTPTATATSTATFTPTATQTPASVDTATPTSTVSAAAANPVAVAAQPAGIQIATGYAAFDPVISKLGLLQADSGQIVWVITLRNTGSGTATNLVVSDTLQPDLRIDRVDIANGTAAVNGQTVTVTIPSLASGASIIFSIYTTATNGVSSGQITNTACVEMTSGDVCATGRVITALPQTGESPSWRIWLLLMGLSLILLSGVMQIRWRTDRQ